VLPYFLDLDDISRLANSCLLEIPVTSMELGPRLLRPLRRRLAQRSLLRRAFRGATVVEFRREFTEA
jgi:hypothetical protein